MGVDTILRSGNVLTMSSESPSPCQAVAIQGERILAVGSDDTIEGLAGENTRLIDLKGRTLLPGFIDSHVHFMQTGLGDLGPKVYGLTSTEAVLAVVADAAGRLPRGLPLLVHGCCLHELDRALSSQDLDRLAPANPVLLVDQGAHACVFNSQAWQMLGLTSDVQGIETGSDGRPTGLLQGVANTRARYAYYSRAVDDDTRAAALDRAAYMALEVGITTVHALDGGSRDGRGWLPQRDAEVLLERQTRLPVHTVMYFQSTNVQLAREWGLSRIGGCLWVDGSYFEHTAGLCEPYADQPCTCGCLYFSQAELDAFVREAHCAGLQVSMHAIGDAAIEQLLLAYERALELQPRPDHRHRIEHFSLPSISHIERSARLGVIASMQPNFAQHPQVDATGRRTGEGLEGLLGTERFNRRHPYRQLLAAGVLVCAGSDSDPQPMGPLIGVQQLASHPEEARHLSPYEALRLYTVNAARAAFQEEDKGTIAVGKLADLVVLGADPLTADAATLSKIPVDLTLVGGRIAYQRLTG